MFTNSSAAEVSRRPTGPHQGPEETGMEQLDPEDGLAVWAFTEGSDAAGGLASPSRAWASGCAARRCSSGIPASGARAEGLIVNPDHDLAAIANRVVTLARSVSREEPGLHRNTQLQQHGRR
jgi:hypothetical protein